MANMGRCGTHGCAYSVRLVNGARREEYCPECALATAQAERDAALQRAEKAEVLATERAGGMEQIAQLVALREQQRDQAETEARALRALVKDHDPLSVQSFQAMMQRAEQAEAALAQAQAELASLLAAVDAAIADREYFHAEEQRVVTALQRAAAVIGEIVIPSPLAYRYYVDNVICVHDRSTITGAEIKARAPDYGPGWSLYRHGKGNDPDVLVQDADVLVLSGERLMCLAIPPALSGGSVDAQPPALPALPADWEIAAVLAQEEK